jgi:hypothetical protein
MKILDALIARLKRQPESPIPPFQLAPDASLLAAAGTATKFRELAEIYAELIRHHVALEKMVHVMAYALGKQPGVYAAWFRHDYETAAAVHWPPDAGAAPLSAAPQIATTILRQFETGAEHRAKPPEGT